MNYFKTKFKIKIYIKFLRNDLYIKHRVQPINGFCRSDKQWPPMFLPLNLLTHGTPLVQIYNLLQVLILEILQFT